jgi:hypothetical protein
LILPKFAIGGTGICFGLDVLRQDLAITGDLMDASGIHFVDDWDDLHPQTNSPMKRPIAEVQFSVLVRGQIRNTSFWNWLAGYANRVQEQLMHLFPVLARLVAC